MSDKEAKLKAYRQKKKLNDLFSGLMNKMKEFIQEDETQNKKRLLAESGSDISDDDKGVVPDREDIIADCDVSSIASNESTLIVDSWSKKEIAWFLAKVSVWLLLFYAAIQVQFGAVFLAISMLLFIYFNTRTEKKKKGEVSAYSVFNKDCKPIEGSLQPEQLQQQMLGGFFYNS